MKESRLILGKEEAEIFSKLTFEERGRLVSMLLADLGLHHLINYHRDFDRDKIESSFQKITENQFVKYPELSTVEVTDEEENG